MFTPTDFANARAAGIRFAMAEVDELFDDGLMAGIALTAADAREDIFAGRDPGINAFIIEYCIAALEFSAADAV